MKPTTEQPTKAGWYWFRKSDQHIWHVWHIIDDGEDGLALECGDGSTDFLENWTGQWAGPLKEPM